MFKSFLLSVIVCLNIYAGDVANYEKLGFSKNGRYFAFIESGTLEEVRNHYVIVRILDTKNDKYVEVFGKRTNEDDSKELRRLRHEVLGTYYRVNKRKYKIREKYKGQTLVYRPYTDFDNFSKKDASFSLWPNTAAYNPTIYTLSIEEKKNSSQKRCNRFGVSHYFTLSVGERMRDGSTTDSKVLHRDRAQKLPRFRKCAEKYRVMAVESLNLGGDKGTINVAIISYWTEALESNSIRHMAVPFSLTVF